MRKNKKVVLRCTKDVDVTKLKYVKRYKLKEKFKTKFSNGFRVNDIFEFEYFVTMGNKIYEHKKFDFRIYEDEVKEYFEFFTLQTSFDQYERKLKLEKLNQHKLSVENADAQQRQ